MGTGVNRAHLLRGIRKSAKAEGGNAPAALETIRSGMLGLCKTAYGCVTTELFRDIPESSDII